MKYSINSINVKYMDKTTLSISSVSNHLNEIIDSATELDMHGRVVSYYIIDDNNSDMVYCNDNNSSKLMLLENKDYWIEINGEVLEGAKLFLKQFIQVVNYNKNGTVKGIFNSNNYVGVLNLEAFKLYDNFIEIESVKIDYNKDFVYLVNEISDFFSELVTRSSSFFETRFKKGKESQMTREFYYSQFAYIKSFFKSDKLPSWIEHIIRNPYSKLVQNKDENYIWDLEEIDLDEYFNSLQDGSNRIKVPEIAKHNLNIYGNSIPIKVMNVSHMETVDVPENSFVKFFLNYLKDVLDGIFKNINNNNKLKYEVNEIMQLVENSSNDAFFSKISNLNFIPFNSQVLQRKYPYNEIFKVYSKLNLMSNLSIGVFDESFSLGQKDVPKLYEYWCFLRIFKVLNDKFDCSFEASEWIRYDNKTLSVTLDSNIEKFVLYDLGENIELKLFYNKKYIDRNICAGRSYSHSLDPDISIELFKNSKLFGIIHFDAKYKINDNESFKEEDLNKMHAYKDAIMGSLGAYILYPGKEKTLFHQEEKYYQSDKVLFPSVGACPFNLGDNRLDEVQNVVSIIDSFIDLVKEEHIEAIFCENNTQSYEGIKRLVGKIN